MPLNLHLTGLAQISSSFATSLWLLGVIELLGKGAHAFLVCPQNALLLTEGASVIEWAGLKID
jgi:hypothetical protein